MTNSNQIAGGASPGKWLIAVTAVAFLLISGCGGDGTEPPAGAHAKDGGERGHGGKGGRSAPPAVAVAAKVPHRGTVSTYYTASASLDPKKEAEVVARISGMILELKAEEGDFVRKGDVLLQVDDREYRARLRQAQAGTARQKAQFERLQKMLAGDLISEEEFEGTGSDLKAAEADEDLASLQVSYTRVEAPFTGRVVRRFVDQGRMVVDGTPLYVVSDLSELLARVHVPSKEFRNIRTDQIVELRVDSSDDPLLGEIILISPIIDPATGTIKVTVRITEYPKSIRPGDFAEVRIVTDRHENVLLVRKTSIISEKGENVVYLAVDGIAERRVVEIGFQDDKYTEIVAGLSGDEAVVFQGQRSLRDEQPVKLLDEVTFETTEPGREES